MRPDEIYLDHAASTPMCPEAVEAMLPWLTHAGNPSGSHRPARDARRAIDEARESLAELTGFGPSAIVFTSGGTEADNLIVSGRHDEVGGRILCSAIEHPAILEPAQAVGATTVAVRTDGRVDLDALCACLDAGVTLVSVMAVNNEIGVIEPLDLVAEVVRANAPNAALHTDAVQALPWIDLRPIGALVDAMSLSAHKFGGPKGVGLLALDPVAQIAPRQRGGGQEHERRSGTHNVAGIVAMAAAARVVDTLRSREVPRVAALRDRLVAGVLARLDDVVETAVTMPGDRSHVIAGNAHLCFRGVESEALLFLLDEAGVCASAASACASGAQHPSHVLEAIGIDRDLAGGSLRLSLGYATTESEVDRAIDAVVASVERLRTYCR